MKCNHCEKETSRFPWKDQDGNIIWKNMFKMDIVSILFLISIIILTVTYMYDTKACRDVMEEPLEFCEDICDITLIQRSNTEIPIRLLMPLEIQDTT